MEITRSSLGPEENHEHNGNLSQEELKRIRGIALDIQKAAEGTLSASSPSHPTIAGDEGVERIVRESDDLAIHATDSLRHALEHVGVEAGNLPKVNIVFRPAASLHGLAQVDVQPDGIEIAFDDRFRNVESERRFIQELRERGIAFPGIEQTLVHELGHIALWSVTGMDRQPATRLIDEGWASLLEHAGSTESTELNVLTKDTKEEVRKGLAAEPAAFERCLNIRHAVTHKEGLNAAEYTVGRALLLWIRETHGSRALRDFLRQSIASTRRNKELEDKGEFEQAAVDPRIHGFVAADSYTQLIASSSALSPEKLQQRAMRWEGEQLERAFLRVTGLRSVEDVQAAFRQWLNR